MRRQQIVIAPTQDEFLGVAKSSKISNLTRKFRFDLHRFAFYKDFKNLYKIYDSALFSFEIQMIWKFMFFICDV